MFCAFDAVVVVVVVVVVVELLFLNKNYCWTPLLSDHTFSPEITPFFSKTTHFPRESDEAPNPALCCQTTCIPPNICPLHREYSLSLKIFLCRNHYFSKSPRQEPFFLCPNHELLSIFH